MFRHLSAGRRHQLVFSLACVIAGNLAAMQAGAAIITVGPDVNCDHSTIDEAIDDTNGTDTYLIRVSGNYSGQHLVINGKHLTLQGGYANCDATTPSGTSTLSAGSHTGDSVIEVRGFAAVTLSNLLLTGGQINSDNGAGAGLNFDGNGSVTLSSVGISHNYSAYGAGINVDSVGGDAVLHIGDNVSIISNTAQFSGGGIRMHGGSTLYLLGNNDFIYENQAIGMTTGPSPMQKDGYGGGIEVVAPSTAFVGSPGTGGGGLIVGNSALYGGGISLTGAGGIGDDPTVVMFTIDPTRPVRISQNIASISGGGIQLESNSGFSTVSSPYLCAQDFRIDGNSAPDGSALYSNDEMNSYVYMNRGSAACTDVSIAGLGARPCAAGITGVSCNLIDGNLARTAGGAATNGGTVTVLDGTQFYGNRFAMLRNHGGRALQLHQDDGILFNISNCLFAENVVTQELLDTESDSPIDIENCTFANNTIGATRALAISDDFKMQNSILWQPGKFSLAHVGGNGPAVVSNVISNDTVDLGGGPTLIDADPRFMDAKANGDYHLQAASAGVDFSASGQSDDIESHARSIDLALKPNLLGAYDLGAYERTDIGNLVRNGDFGSDLHLWTDVTGGASSWDGTTDHAGSTSSGSVDVTVPNLSTSILGLTHCVHLPGLSDYALSGYARAFSSTLPTGPHNHASIVWELRSDSDDCSGPTIASGELLLPSSSPIAWRSAAAPALIPALTLGSRFTANTTVALTLKASSDGSTGGGAWFDGISLTPTDGDSIFANGFDP